MEYSPSHRVKAMIRGSNKETRELGIITMLGELSSKGDWKRLRRSFFWKENFSKIERKKIMQSYCQLQIGKRKRDERRALAKNTSVPLV